MMSREIRLCPVAELLLLDEKRHLAWKAAVKVPH
jgi:hypothetical protein